MAIGLPLQLSDLCGLFRLYRDRDRAWAALRLSAADQFQPALHLRVLLRILDALAHFVINLAADLSLHPAGWQPPWGVPNLSEHHDRDGTRRPLARRRPKLSCLGHHARRPARAGAFA